MKAHFEIREALRHLYAARDGAERAARPSRGVVLNADDSKREALRNEDAQKVVILNRMIDSLQWVLGEPSELAEWIRQFERMDQIEKTGFAARQA